MTRLIPETLSGPRTLFGQTLLALITGIGLALAAGAFIYTSARQEAVRAIGALAAAERIVNVARLIEEAPSDWRQRLAEGSSDASFRVTLSGQRPELAPQAGDDDPAAALGDFLNAELPGRTVLVAVATAPGERPLRGPGHHGAGARGRDGGWGPGMGGGFMPGGGSGGGLRGPLARAAQSWRGLDVAVDLAPTQWLRFSTALPETGPTMSPRLLLALAVMAGMIALLTAWLVRRLTRPLDVLADAASRLGRNVAAPPLALTGTLEIQRAAEAFNEMQSRLRRLIDNRTLMLGAISHDLRTQLMLLRLRAEGTAAGEDRERMLKTIAEMEAMLSATLTFAREDSRSEEPKRVDIGALVTSIADDMADAGLAVAIGTVAEGVIAECRPVALGRAVRNLIDNAIKYAGAAAVSLRADAQSLDIIIDDQGPGIPADQLETVLQPFTRLETSRNLDTGGMGLGLAIASAIATAHGGALTLSNRSMGGLRATLSIPRSG